MLVYNKGESSECFALQILIAQVGRIANFYLRSGTLFQLCSNYPPPFKTNRLNLFYLEAVPFADPL